MTCLPLLCNVSMQVSCSCRPSDPFAAYNWEMERGRSLKTVSLPCGTCQRQLVFLPEGRAMCLQLCRGSPKRLLQVSLGRLPPPPQTASKLNSSQTPKTCETLMCQLPTCLRLSFQNLRLVAGYRTRQS